MSPSPHDAGSSIQITREEAFSDHVEDLLNRQRSLRGEKGVTREGKGKWYYQNWFVFMLVGLVAGLIAWSLLEPVVDDYSYIQGVVTRTALTPEDPSAQLEANAQVDSEADAGTEGDAADEGDDSSRGRITINDEELVFTPYTVLLRNGERVSVLGNDELEEGREVGVFVEAMPFGEEPLNIVEFVELNPPKPASAKGRMSLERQSARDAIGSLLFFAVVAGCIGLAIGAADGAVCRLPRRAFLAGSVGLIVGFIGGGIMGVVAGLIYAPLTALAMGETVDTPGQLGFLAFALQMTGRGLAWCLAGMAMGLGQGIALRSKRLVLYGFLGGVIGGLLGGLLFDPIDILMLGGVKPSAHWSRLVGLVVIGMSVGATIGIVELLSRDVWLRMTQGPLTGKEFILFKDTMMIGASPKSDIYLFNDPAVGQNHATLRLVGDTSEIECTTYPQAPVYVNGRPVKRARLLDGDQIAIGNTQFIFEKRAT